MTEAIEYHNREAKKFKDKYLEKRSFKARLNIWNSLIRDSGSAVSKAMDIGCGPGWMTQILCDVSKTVVAIDGSEQMIEQSRETLGEAKDRVEFFHAQITPKLFDSWAAGSFDLIISSSVLEYVGNIDKILGKTFTLLSSNGTLIFSLPNNESLFRLIEGRLYQWFGKPHYRGLLMNVWTSRQTISVLEQIGFKIESIQFQGYVPFFSPLFFWLPERFQRPMMVIVARK